MAYHHLSHLDSFAKHIQVGTKIRRGDPIGKVGASGTRWAHLHYEVKATKPQNWRQYIWGMTKEQVEAAYPDPDHWVDKRKHIPARYETYGGYEYLSPIKRNDQILGYHPGVDINWGSGHDDYGSPIKSPCEGEVVYVGKNEGGWGNHCWIKEDEEKTHPKVDWNFAKKHAGKMFLQVEEHGEGWYVNPEGVRHYIGSTPTEMLAFVQRMAVGISNADLSKIPVGTENPNDK